MKKIIILNLILLVFFASFGLAEPDSKDAELLFMAKKAYEDGFYEVSLGMLERLGRDYQNSTIRPQADLLSGQCYFQQGRYLEALNIFQSLTENRQAAGFKDALYFWMGEVHFKSGNFEKAAEFYQKLISSFAQSPLEPAAYYSLGWAFYQEGKFAQSVQTFQILISKFPDEPQSRDAYFKLVESLYQLKDYAQLEEKIKPVFKLYSNDDLRLPYLYFYLAESQYYLDNFDQAAKNYLKSAQSQKEPKAQSLARLGLGWSYLKLLKYKEAEEALAAIKAESLDKKSLEIFILGKALLMSATNRVYESRKLYDQLINLSTDPLVYLQAYLGKADAFYNLAEYEQAAKVYQEGLVKFSQDGQAAQPFQELTDKLRYNLGLVYIKQGKIDLSLEIFKNITVNAGSAYAELAQYQLSSLQLQKSDYPAAVASSKALLDNYPHSKYLPEATYAQGLAYFKNSDFAKSAEVFQGFRKNFKESQLYPQALYMLGVSFAGAAKFEEGLSVFKDILRLNTADNELLQKTEYEIADCYYQLGQEEEAVNRFKLLRSKYPDSELAPEILWWLGQYYYHKGDSSLSRRYFNSLIKDYPKSRMVGNANYALVDIYIQEGDPEAALEQYNKIGQRHPEADNLIFYRIARAYYKTGNYPQARAFYLKSLDKVSLEQEARVRFELGETLDAQSQVQEAIQEYALVAKLNIPENDLSLRALLRVAKLYEDREDFKKSLEAYKQVILKYPSAAQVDFVRERIAGLKEKIKY